MAQLPKSARLDPPVVKFLKKKKRACLGGTQSVKRSTLDFGLDPDLRVVRSSPASGSTLSGESA